MLYFQSLYQVFKLNSTPNMLEYFKVILSKVSFSKSLFEKELRKAIRSILMEELVELRDWCYKKFGHIYQSVINRCFSSVNLSLT